MNNTSEINPKSPLQNNYNPYPIELASFQTNQNNFKQSILKTNIINSFFRNFYSNKKIGIQTIQTARFFTHSLFRRPEPEQHSYLKTTITIFKNVVMCSFKYKKVV